MTRSVAKHPGVTAAVKDRLAAALATVSDDKPLSKGELATLATDLLKAQEPTTPSAA
jgi:hypothetical protein